ncbi:MYND-type zinc finger-containing chromatin reader Zmynd8 isoform X2 [Toxorhynchites rutilus septentrionalis]|uniref:MYND-type zinc finger-containing chromatin reader Zmynd8 isoform X2 n=1 Tax=Toxorhynchites rutilus septentrionalis TaxID=329112 RepID=UPI0024798AF5|nr:MYND-type zinc finger-containing chromatin reader Zmynd8 isoform X2 [Toxorhynchites rutilus septentrionalis]
MSTTSTPKDAARLASNVLSPTSPIVSSPITTSMIDTRNVYKISPGKPTVISPQQQDIVKIRLTKDDSGNGIGYTKSIITNSPVSPEDKTESKTTPQKMSINLAQQPTLQLKTSQNKIVLVKMLPKMPQNCPKVITAPTPGNSVSPTTLGLTKSVQGIRPFPSVTSPSSCTVTSFIVTKSPAKEESNANREKNYSLILSNATTATTSTTCTIMTEPKKSSPSFSSNESINKSSPTGDKPEESLNKNSEDMADSGAMLDGSANDENDSSNVTNVKMSREMRCLKASQSSSKILTEFMQDSFSSEKLRKRRRSRCEGDDSRSCGSVTPTSLKRYSVSGRDEEDLDESKCSPMAGMKRTGMRSANVEFSMKQRKFLSSIHQHSDGSDNSDNETDPSNIKVAKKVETQIPVAPKPGWDKFCWRCKTCDPGLEACTACVRCFHPVCMKLNPAYFIVEKKWNCPECVKLHQAEEESGKDKLKIDSLTVSLKFAMKRMQMLKGSTIFNPLEKEQYPNYDQYVTKHTDLKMLQKNVSDQRYQTTDGFQADVSWILHNAAIYPNNNKLLPVAKSLLKICKQEMNEIEACNECYFNANTSQTWFIEVCAKPHLLVWAKLKGFPFWPAKLMSVNNNQLADVRFFGDHDRAWVPIKECFLFCEKDPNTKLQRRSNMAECMREAEAYISKIKKKFGQFHYAEFRTPVEMNKLDDHLDAMIPGVLKKLSENGDSHKAKLMLKIIKTADNFLSISPVSISPANASTPKNSHGDKTTVDKAQDAEDIKDKVQVIGSTTEGYTEKSEKVQKTLSRNRSKSVGPIKEEVRNSVSTPEPGEGTSRAYFTRKRKSVSPPEEIKVKEAEPDASQMESKTRGSRTNSLTGNKIKENDVISSAASNSPAILDQRSYPFKKRRSDCLQVDINKPDKQSKIESVVIQRKSDSWKTVPATKKQIEFSEEKFEAKENDLGDVSVTDTISRDTTLVSEKEKQIESSNTILSQKNTNVTTENPPLIVQKNRNAQNNNETEEKSRFAVVPLVPLATDEIKTEPSENEVTPAIQAVAEPSTEVPVVPSSDQTSSAGSNFDQTTTIVPQQLRPIKIEPLSDEETSSAIDGAAPASIGEPPHQNINMNQVVIRTNNRIMVKDINRLTNQIGTHTNTITNSNGQPIVLTPVDKPKGVPKVSPKMVSNVQQKVRKSFPGQQVVSNFTPLTRPPTAPSAMSVLPTGSNPGGKNVNNMMHMVHIPSPLTSTNDQSRTEQVLVGGPALGHASQTRPQQQTITIANNNLSTSTNITNNQAQAPAGSGVPAVGVIPTVDPSSSASASGTSATSAESQHMMSGFITPNLAAAVTETIVSTPPKLQSRPSGALRSEGDAVYPSGAGPVSQILINNSYKMADFFRSVIEDTLADLSNNSGALEAKVKVLELEIEKLKHCHQQEITKLKHNSDLVLCEMRNSIELEKTRIINEVRKQCEMERIRSVEEAKKKQWCINCGKEALFYCCWNTSYCDYPCQQQHWAIHMNNCTQSQFNLPSTAIASKPSNVINNKVTTQHITTPKITTVQTLHLNGRSGLTIQPTQQQQQLIITSARGGAQLGKGQSFQRLR